MFSYMFSLSAKSEPESAAKIEFASSSAREGNFMPYAPLRNFCSFIQIILKIGNWVESYVRRFVGYRTDGNGADNDYYSKNSGRDQKLELHFLFLRKIK